MKLFDIQNYKNSDLIYTLFEKFKNIDSNINYAELEQYLLSSVKDQYDDETWFVVKLTNGHRYFTTNNLSDEAVEIDHNQPLSSACWMFINLFDITHNSNTQRDKKIELLFVDLISELSNIPGLIVAGIHYADKQTIVSPHADYSENDHFVNVVLVSRSTPDTSINLPDHKYNLFAGQIFCFDASQIHSVENLTDQEFVALTLRIKKDQFDEIH